MRPLKFVPIVQLDLFKEYNDNLLDVIFGNFGYFIVGDYSDKEELLHYLPEYNE